LQFDALEAPALARNEAVKARWADLRSYQQDGVAFLASRESALLAARRRRRSSPPQGWRSA
jgi:hypothetical protein